MKTIATISHDSLKIEAVLKTVKFDEFISYDEIEQRSEVKMDTKGKGYLRTALNRLKYQYSPIRGEGIEITGPCSAPKVTADTVIKIDRANKRGHKRVKGIVNAPYFEEIDPLMKKDILCVSSMLETLTSHSKATKVFFAKPAPPKALNS